MRGAKGAKTRLLRAAERVWRDGAAAGQQRHDNDCQRQDDERHEADRLIRNADHRSNQPDQDRQHDRNELLGLAPYESTPIGGDTDRRDAVGAG